MSKLELHIPTENELEYRRHLIFEKETMNYNMGYGDDGTGCYYQTIEQVQEWYKNWNNSTDNYYAYIIRKEDNTLIGEVDIHWSRYSQKSILSELLLKQNIVAKVMLKKHCACCAMLHLMS